MSFVVYRMYDADEELLYVGRSTRGFNRIEEHRFKEWWKEVDLVTVEHFATRDESAAAEREAIVHEAPKFNRHGLAKKVVDIVALREDAGVEPSVRMLPAALKAWRSERGLTEDELARRAGLASGVIELIEEDAGSPMYGDAVRIADALGVSLEAIATEVA